MAKYFGKEEEQAIRDYLQETSKFEKDKLYKEKLKEPIETLVESILGIYGKKYQIFDTGLSFKRLKRMGLSYLFKKMDKFDPSRGSKAYSFFGTILRNYYLKLKQDYDAVTSRKLNIHDKDLMQQFDEEYLCYYENHENPSRIFLEKLIR